VYNDFYVFCKPLEERISDLKKITTLQYKAKKQAIDIENTLLDTKVKKSTLRQHKYYVFFGFLMFFVAVATLVTKVWK
jgi:hypothetical protein